MVDRQKTKEEVKAILEDIKHKAGELVDVDGVPVAEFRLAHRSCFTKEEEAGFISGVEDNFVVNLFPAGQDVCETHGVKSMKYALRNPMHKKIGEL